MSTPLLLGFLGGALAIGVGILRSPHDAVSGGDFDFLALDFHLPEPTQRAVHVALEEESNPELLYHFADALLPEFPSAASALVAKASLLGQGTVTGIDLNPFHVIKSLAKDLGVAGVASAIIPGIGIPKLFIAAVASHPAGKIANATIGQIPVVKSVAHEIDKIGKSPVFAAAQHVFVTLHPAVFGSMLIASAGNDALSGQRLDKVLNDTRIKTGKWLKEEGSLASVIPGIGTALSAALTTAGALALGEPIPEAMIDIGANAVPGGIAAQTAVRSGATFAVDIAKGKKLDEAGMDAARAAAIGAGMAAGIPKEITGSAFDLGFGIAQGKNLQKAGFAMASSLLKSSSGAIGEKALEAINHTGAGDLVSRAAGALNNALPAGAADMAKHAAGVLTTNPTIRTSMQLAKQARVPEAVGRAVLASTTREKAHPALPTQGAPVVHARALHALVGRPNPPASLDSAHVALAIRAEQGDPSAAKQLAFLQMQDPTQAGSVDAAQRAASRTTWIKRYHGPIPTLRPS